VQEKFALDIILSFGIACVYVISSARLISFFDHSDATASLRWCTAISVNRKGILIDETAHFNPL